MATLEERKKQFDASRLEKAGTRKTYQSQFYLANIDRNISTTIYQIAMRYYKKQYKKKGKGRRAKAAGPLTKYFLWLYLTGSRVSEPLTKPYPIISIRQAPKSWPTEKVIHIERVILKSFEKKDIVGTNIKGKPVYKGRRDSRTILTQNIPLFDDEYEAWKVVLDDFENTDLSQTFEEFQPNKKGTPSTAGSITHLLSYNFKYKLKDTQGNVYEDRHINPHMLRHLRAHNLSVQRGLGERLIISLFGWKSSYMLYRHYSYTAKEIKNLEQMEMWNTQFIKQPEVAAFKLPDNVPSVE